MRHLKTINHLGRTSSHRKAMLSNMAASLIIHKRITTTTAKARALRKYVEPLVTKAKDDSTHSRRVVFSYLQDKEAVTELFREISPKVADRPGGYTRILKTGNRLGDNAEMCIIELVDFNELMLEETQAGKSKSARRRRSSKKKNETTVTKTRETKAGKVEKQDLKKVQEAGDTIPETAGEAAAETSAEAAAETAAEISAEAAAETAAETSAEAAAETAAETSAEAAAETAAETSAEAAAETSDPGADSESGSAADAESDTQAEGEK